MVRTPLFFFTTLLIFLTGCNGGDEPIDAVLQQPPYATTTDSITRQPTPALHYRRAVLLYQNNEMALAEQDMRKAWQQAKEETYALGLIDILTKKNSDSALLFAQDVIKVLPQSVALLMKTARLHNEKGQPEKALAICNQLLAAYPNQLDALGLKAEVLQTQNKPAEALTTLETAYAYAPFDVELSYQLAFAYAEAKNKKALALTDSLIRMDTSGTHAEPYYFKGIYYENTNNLAQAIRFYDAAIQHDYYFIDAYVSKGELLYNQKKWADALQTFQLATRVSPTYAEAYYWMGRCEEAMNEKANAKLNYQRAYGLDKTLSEAKAAADKL